MQLQVDFPTAVFTFINIFRVYNYAVDHYDLLCITLTMFTSLTFVDVAPQ